MSFEPSKVARAWSTYRDTVLPRFLFNIKPGNLWYNEPNPYDLPKMRPAREDLGHSYVDLFVEGIRASAYGVGHLLAVLAPFGLLAIIGAIVT
jgi:hypothetical protein